MKKITTLLRRLLLPIGWIYGVVMFFRNRAFDWGWLKQTSFLVPTIVVGNITVGGTGKTPVTEYLINLLSKNYKVGLLSRGYGRKTKGVLYADDTVTANSIGDEPFQIKSKFPNIDVCVAEKRVLGAKVLVNKGVDLIVCDDAFQHRYLKPTRSIVVVDFNRPLWSDFMLPAGELRESPNEINRANIVIINKTPQNLSISERDVLLNKMAFKIKKNIFFTSIDFGAPYALNNNSTLLSSTQKMVALSGIANSESFNDFVESNYDLVEKIAFGDHHNFTEQELDNIAYRLQKKNDNCCIITTEKDAARLKLFPNFKYSSKTWVLPIKISFLFGEEERFNSLIKNYAAEIN